MTDLPVTVAILFEHTAEEFQDSWLQMSLAWCTSVDSTECLLAM